MQWNRKLLHLFLSSDLELFQAQVKAMDAMDAPQPQTWFRTQRHGTDLDLPAFSQQLACWLLSARINCFQLRQLGLAGQLLSSLLLQSRLGSLSM